MLEINVYHHDSILVAELRGHLNSQCATDFRRWFEGQIERGSIYIAIDLFDVEYISSMGISILIELHSLAKQAQGCLVFFNTNDEVKKVFNFLKFDKKLPILSNTKHAISTLIKYKRDYPVQERTKVNSSLNLLDGSDELILFERENFKNSIETSSSLNEDQIKTQELQQKKNFNEKNNILDCPRCNKKMKIKEEGGDFMCPHCEDSVILIEREKL